MKKFLVFLCAVPLVFGVAEIASALSISVYDDIPDYTYIATGSSLSGTFDINAEVPTDGQYVIPYDVESGYATFQFSDDGDLDYNYSNYGSYSYHHYSNNYYYYTRYVYHYFSDEYDQVQLNLEGEYSLDGTNWYSQVFYDGQSYDGSHWYGTYGTVYYSWHYDYNSGYGGTINIYHPLADDAKLALSENGIVDFTLTATQGDIVYNWGTLNAEINPNPIPEPPIMLLFGSGLIGLAWFRRKFKKK